MQIIFDFIWVPSSLGGHGSEPYEGMKTTIRWQKYLNEFLQCARDVQWVSVDFEVNTRQGKAVCKFTSEEPLPEEWLREGELIELLNGYRVLAIGRLTT